MQHGVGIDAAVQQCSDAVMQRCGHARLAGQPQASACSVVIRREARPAPLNFWSGRFSCGALASIGYIVPQRATVPTYQRANDACSATCFQGRGGTEVHGANRGHDAREAVGRL
jgi:hypothetical protein